MHQPQFDGIPTTEQYRAYLTSLLNETLIGRAENIPLTQAADRTLAQDVFARLDIPGFDNSQMDGYALTAEGASRQNRIFTVGREIPAGKPLQRSRASGELTYPVMTGAPIPPGYAAVVPVEDSERPQYPQMPESFGQPSEKVRLPKAPEGQYIRRRGEDVQAGSILARSGERITPALLGALAAQGYTRVTVESGPRVLICTGGDEVRPGMTEATEDTAGELRPGQIYDANGPMLASLLEQDGATVRHLRMGDDPQLLLELLQEEYGHFTPDMIVTSGGISHGKYEVVRNAVHAAPKSGLPVPFSWFGHVSQQPGGPQGISVLKFAGHRVPLISFPGNPVSTLISYILLLRPFLRTSRYCGIRNRVTTAHAHPVPDTPHGILMLREPLRAPAQKRQFLRGNLVQTQVEPGTYRLELYPDPQPGSHLLHHAALADVLIELAPGRTYTGGEAVPYHRLNP